MKSTLAGSIAGLVATIPMSVAMHMLHQRLPRHQRYPLPPRLITERVARQIGVERHLSDSVETQATLASHLGYGTAMGGLYGSLMSGAPLPPAARGAAFGLLVWAVSYLGLMPSLGLMHPVTQVPRRRNALMIAAHLVWGAITGLTAEVLKSNHIGDKR